METIENPNVPTPFYRSEVVICDKCKSESVEPVFEQHLCKLELRDGQWQITLLDHSAKLLINDHPIKKFGDYKLNFLPLSLPPLGVLAAFGVLAERRGVLLPRRLPPVFGDAA